MCYLLTHSIDLLSSKHFEGLLNGLRIFSPYKWWALQSITLLRDILQIIDRNLRNWHTQIASHFDSFLCVKHKTLNVLHTVYNSFNIAAPLSNCHFPFSLFYFTIRAHRQHGNAWLNHTVRVCLLESSKVSLCLAKLFVFIMRQSLETLWESWG